MWQASRCRLFCFIELFNGFLGVMALILGETDLSPDALAKELVKLAAPNFLTNVPSDTPNLMVNNGV